MNTAEHIRNYFSACSRYAKAKKENNPLVSEPNLGCFINLDDDPKLKEMVEKHANILKQPE